MEYFDTFNEEGVFLSSEDENDVHYKGLWHKVIRVWLYDDDGNIYLRRRKLDNKLDCINELHMRSSESVSSPTDARSTRRASDAETVPSPSASASFFCVELRFSSPTDARSTTRASDAETVLSPSISPVKSAEALITRDESIMIQVRIMLSMERIFI